jgi:hypothetical protein
MVSFVKQVLLQMRVRGKIYRRKWNITQQTRRCTPIKPKKPKLSDDVHRTSRYSALGFGSFALDLEADFSVDFQCKHITLNAAHNGTHTISSGFVKVYLAI